MLLVFNMSATMPGQGGHVHLEYSDMCLALNIAKMAKGGFSCATREETQYLIKKCRAEVWEVKKWGVEFPGHNKVKAATESHLAMLRQNHTTGSLPCQNCTTINAQRRWRCNRPGVPPPDQHRQLTPKLMPPLPGMPPAPTSNKSGAQHSHIVNLLAGFAYSHTALPCAECFTLEASAQDSQQVKDFDPDMLTDEGTSTG